MILQHVIAIDIAPVSPVALNPVITKAHNAGIIDYRRGIRLVAAAPRACDLCNSFADYGTGLATEVASALRTRATPLPRNGTAGTGPDTTSTSTCPAELKKYPDIEGGATIDADGSPDTTLPALARLCRVSARPTTAEDYLKLQMELAAPQAHQVGVLTQASIDEIFPDQSGPPDIPVVRSARSSESHDVNIGAAGNRPGYSTPISGSTGRRDCIVSVHAVSAIFGPNAMTNSISRCMRPFAARGASRRNQGEMLIPTPAPSFRGWAAWRGPTIQPNMVNWSTGKFLRGRRAHGGS
jgi:hypothetical protein